MKEITEFNKKLRKKQKQLFEDIEKTLKNDENK